MSDENQTSGNMPTGDDDNQANSEQPIKPIGSFGRDGNFTTRIKIPTHSLNFDEKNFLRLLAGSISLTKDEKKRIILAVPKLTQFQIDELIKILEEEKRKFSELDVKHEEQLRKLEEKHIQEWEQLELEEEKVEKASEDQSQADDIRKSLGL